jgi:glycosyltransferase involved in cell wall biosynthesis
VTVGVCVKDSEATIGAAIESVAKQDFPHDRMELIIVDDGSEDRTLEVIKSEISVFDLNTQLFSQPWKGIAFSRQVVVENARGKYVVWVDADEVLSSSFVRKQVEFMEQNPEIGIAVGQEPLQTLSREGALVVRLETMYILAQQFDNTRFKPGTGGSICRIAVIKEVGGFDTGNRAAAEDIDLINRIRLTKWKFSSSPAEYIHRRRKTWRGLWDEYFWWGSGTFYTAHKENTHFDPTNLPPVVIVFGLRDAFRIYRALRLNAAFLLPFQYFFKRLAWCLGYFKSSIGSPTQKG